MTLYDNAIYRNTLPCATYHYVLPDYSFIIVSSGLFFIHSLQNNTLFFRHSHYASSESHFSTIIIYRSSELYLHLQPTFLNNISQYFSLPYHLPSLMNTGLPFSLFNVVMVSFFRVIGISFFIISFFHSHSFIL